MTEYGGTATLEARPTPLITLRLEAATMTQFSLPLRPNPAPLAKRLAAQIMKPEGEDGCWLWTGPVFTATGTCVFSVSHRPTTSPDQMKPPYRCTPADALRCR